MKVWHTGLLYKIKKYLPHTYFNILNLYLTDRCFEVKFNNVVPKLYPIKSGIPQGSVLGPVLYLLFTADLPITHNITIGTYADDTALMAIHKNPQIASQQLQESIIQMEIWYKKWRIKANEDKSIHVTFTLTAKNLSTYTT